MSEKCKQCKLNDLCKSCKPQGIPTCELLQDAAKKIKKLNVWVKNHLDEVSSLQEKVYFVEDAAWRIEELEETCETIVALSAGWDENGSLGPRKPMSWETVGRLAMNWAKTALAGKASSAFTPLDPSTLPKVEVKK